MAPSPFNIEEHVIDASYMREYPRGASSQYSPLKLAIKKYTPVDNLSPQPGDVTLIGAHGGGFPKELYEPLWEELLARTEANGFRIRAIWVADSANQGVSGILNEEHLGNDPSWLDHSRDLLHMINHFRNDMPQPIMGVGHSMGAVQLMFLSLLHPRVLRSLLLIEPFIYDIEDGSNVPMMALTAKKKDIWPDRTTAIKKSGPMFQIWDPRVLERWVKYGYRELPTVLYPDSKTPGAVTLATSKNQEIFSYLREDLKRHRELGQPRSPESKDSSPIPPHDPLFYPDVVGDLLEDQQFYRPEPLMAWRALPHYRPSAFYLGAGKSLLWRTGRIERAAKLMGTGISGSGGMQYERVKYAVIPKAFHTLPMEKVAEAADALAPWITGELKRWEQDERRIAEGWDGLSPREKNTPSKEWQSSLLPGIEAVLARQKSSKL